MTTPSNESHFLLLLRQPQGGPGPTTEELRHIMSRFSEWMKRLTDKGALVSNNGLENTGRILRGPGGASVTDGPFS